MSLAGQYDNDNVFAKILRGEMQNITVYEDENTLAFMDVFPQSKGHTLIVHKRETARNILDISPQGLSDIIKTVQIVAKAIASALEPDGIVVTQFNGAPAGQTVFHLHFHVIPKYGAQGLKNHAQGTMADGGELTAIAAKIQNAIPTRT